MEHFEQYTEDQRTQLLEELKGKLTDDVCQFEWLHTGGELRIGAVVARRYIQCDDISTGWVKDPASPGRNDSLEATYENFNTIKIEYPISWLFRSGRVEIMKYLAVTERDYHYKLFDTTYYNYKLVKPDTSDTRFDHISRNSYMKFISEVCFPFFNHYLTLEGTLDQKKVKTIEYLKEWIRKSNGKWSYEEELNLVALKRKYFGEESLTASDLATDIIGNF